MECMKEVTHRVLKLVENLADEGSIAGIIDTDGMTRRYILETLKMDV